MKRKQKSLSSSFCCGSGVLLHDDEGEGKRMSAGRVLNLFRPLLSSSASFCSALKASSSRASFLFTPFLSPSKEELVCWWSLQSLLDTQNDHPLSPFNLFLFFFLALLSLSSCTFSCCVEFASASEFFSPSLREPMTYSGPPRLATPPPLPQRPQHLLHLS